MPFKESLLGTVTQAIISWPLWKALECVGN